MIKSHIPGSLEYLDDDSDPLFSPIDRLIERYTGEELEFAQFHYKGVDYLIEGNGMDDDSWCLYFQPPNRPNGILIRTFPTFLDLLDTPILHDGETIRTAFVTSAETYVN